MMLDDWLGVELGVQEPLPQPQHTTEYDAENCQWLIRRGRRVIARLRGAEAESLAQFMVRQLNEISRVDAKMRGE